MSAIQKSKASHSRNEKLASPCADIFSAANYRRDQLSNEREACAGRLMTALVDSTRGTRKSESEAFNLVNRKLQLMIDQLGHDFAASTIGRKELFIWVLLEIVDTEVGFSEIEKWAGDEPTIDEIVFHQSDDRRSMASLLRESNEAARERIVHLIKKHL